MEGNFGTNECVITWFERMCQKYPDKPAVIFLGEKLSYVKMKELIDRFATALHNMGVSDNDRVMIYVTNCPQFLIAYFAAQEIGAIPVPVSPIYTPSEITYLINDSGAETILCQDTNFGYVKEVLSKTCLKRVIVTNLVDLLPWWKRRIGKLFDKVPKGVVERSERIYLFRDLIHKYPPQPPKVSINPREHLAYLLYTSGTTGFPKGASGTHANMGSIIQDYHTNIKEHVRRGGEDVLILVIPLFHMLAMVTILGWGLSLGISTVVMPFPLVDAILEAIQRCKGTMFIGVPALYRMILENDRVDQYKLSTLRYCWSGGDVLPLTVYNRWKEKFNVPIYQAFGSTEIGVGSLSPLDNLPVPGSIGFPVASRKAKIVDPVTLESVPVGTTGELLITSELMTKSYWNKPEETANSFVEIGGEIWYRTKDYVRMDKDGLIYYTDRSADVIKYKGYRISCSEIEATLQDHHAVIEACVVGVPDDKVGERIKAIVVIKGNERGVGTSELIKWCRERLAPYKIPDHIEFRDMLPKSKVGKLLRREIREEERRRTAGANKRRITVNQ